MTPTNRTDRPEHDLENGRHVDSEGDTVAEEAWPEGTFDPDPEADHEDDSYGACVICREWVPRTDDELRLVKWPCPTERLRRLEAEVAAGPRDEGLREWLDSPLRDYLDERDRAYLNALAKASDD